MKCEQLVNEKNSIFSYSQSYPQYPQETKVDKYDKTTVKKIYIKQKNTTICHQYEKRM